jgi:hypothetical protein
MSHKFYSLFREKISKLVLIDILFFTSLFLFIRYSHNRMISYISTIQQFSPQLSNIEPLLEQRDTTALLQLQDIVNVIEPVVKEAQVFLYLIVPLLIFALYSFFQGMSFNIINSKGITNKAYYLKFALVSLPAYILGLFIIQGWLTSSGIYLSGTAAPFSLMLALILPFLGLSYLAFISYNTSFAELKAMAKKWIMFPLMMAIMLLYIFAGIASLSAFLAMSSGSYWSILIFLIVLLFLKAANTAKLYAYYIVKKHVLRG